MGGKGGLRSLGWRADRDLAVAHEIADDLLLVRMEHLEDFLDVLLLPFPSVSHDALVCRRAEATPDAQHGVQGGAEAPPPVPAEHELVQIGVGMLLSEPVELPSAHRFRLAKTM